MAVLLSQFLHRTAGFRAAYVSDGLTGWVPCPTMSGDPHTRLAPALSIRDESGFYFGPQRVRSWSRTGVNGG